MDYKKQSSHQIPLAISAIDKQIPKQTNCFAFNQRGSALLICLSAIPLLLSSLIAALSVVWFLEAKNELLFVCEKSLLQTQNQLVKAENEILKLNTPIETLVLEKKVLKKALVLATTPADRALVKAQLVRIELKLASYQQKQSFLILNSQANARALIQSAASKIKKRLAYYQNQWAAQLWVQVKNTNPLTQLQPQRIDPSATVYKIPLHFQKKQTLNLQWNLQGQSLFPSWVKLLRSQKFFWQDSCSSRPNKKETHTWTSELGAGIF